MKHSVLTGLLAAGALALTATYAQAIPLVYQDVFPVGYPGTLQTTDWTRTFSVSQFNSSLFGTLNSVTVYFEGAILSDMTLDNNNTTAVTVFGNVNSNIFGTFVGNSLLVNPSASTGSVSLTANGNPGEVRTFTGLGGTDNQTITPGSLTPYIGTGSLSSSIGTLASFGVSGGGGNVNVTVATKAGALLRVTYDYTPTPPTQTPEPASIALLGLGLAGLGVWRRRKV